jgi:hypothetical protein
MLHDKEPVNHPSPAISSHHTHPEGKEQGPQLQPKLQPQTWTAHACFQETQTERTSWVHQLSCRNSLASAVALAPQPKPLCPCGAPAPRRNESLMQLPETNAETPAPSITPCITEASQGANTLATSPDKPPESLTIRPCEQGRREADTECRHNRKRNLRRRVQREQATRSSTKDRQPSDMARKPHQWQHHWLLSLSPHPPRREGAGTSAAAETAGSDLDRARLSPGDTDRERTERVHQR